MPKLDFSAHEVATIIHALNRDADRYRELRNPTWNAHITKLENLAGRIQRDIRRSS